MLNLTRVLCATDFSEFSERAERYAVALAKRYGARLRLLHVDPPLALLAPYGEIPTELRIFKQQRAEAERAMRLAHDRAAAAGVVATVEIRGGAPAHEILDAAAQADLVVLATHGRSGFERFMLGSVAEKVLRKATCPVLVVPPGATAPPDAVFARVVCPTDGSEASAAAVDAGLSLIREADGVLHLLEVVEPLPAVSEFDALDDERYIGRACALAAARLHAAVTAEVRQCCRIEEEVAQGHVAERILGVATTTHADLLVMGVRGRNALDLFTFGSTTNQVVRRAGCPVLVVHPAASTRVAPSSVPWD